MAQIEGEKKGSGVGMHMYSNLERSQSGAAVGMITTYVRGCLHSRRRSAKGPHPGARLGPTIPADHPGVGYSPFPRTSGALVDTDEG